jgi:peptidoglycan/LPS O-acetylase OafA/YrhL
MVIVSALVLLEPASAFVRVTIFNMAALGTMLTLPAAVQRVNASGPVARGVIWLSTRSYAIYIMHLTVSGIIVSEAIGKGYLSRWLFLPVAFFVVGLLAEISYRYFEMPILRMRPKQVTRKVGYAKMSALLNFTSYDQGRRRLF